MFIIDQTIEDLKIRERTIFKVLFSMNNHQVATPEMMLEEARSYIMFFREPRDKISAYIGLHLLLTDRKLFYAHSSNPFSAEELETVQEEALGFAEGLGAMLDELDFSHLSAEEAHRWIDKQDIFKSTSEPESLPDTQEREAGYQEPQAGNQASQEPAHDTDQAIPAQISLQNQEQPLQTEPRAQQASPPGPPVQPQSASAEPAESSPRQLAQPPQHEPDTPVQPASQQPVPIPPEVPYPQPAHAAPSSATSQQQASSAAYAPQSSQTPSPDDRQESRAAAEEASPYAPMEYQTEGRKTENRSGTQRDAGTGPEEKREKPPSRTTGPKTLLAEDRGKAEPLQQAIDTGFVKVPKTSAKKANRPTTGVVSREREALARLLTSF